MTQRPLPLSLPFLRSLQLCTLTLGLAGLGACSSADAPLPSTQVAAQVGAEEISLHQINTVLAQGRNSNATPEQTQERSRAILESLIDQQLAVEQALAAKLDRAPDVMAQVDAAQREVLASAYVRQFAATVPKPDAQEVRAYYTEHPALFAERRIFSIQEIVTARTPEVLEQLQRMAAENRPLEEAADWLKTRNIPFTPGAASRAAEQIPLEYLARMQALQEGQTAAFTTPTAITLLRVVALRNAPIAEAAAQPRIEQFLGNQRTSDAITTHMKTLRENTLVEYKGAFQSPAAVAAAQAAAAASAPPSMALDNPIAAGNANPAGNTTPASTGPSTLEKGVAGLK